MTRRPKVVIGVPLYNGAEHLAEAVESLLCQTNPDFDLVMVDDCSSDQTAEIVGSYAADDARIHFSVNRRRLGLVANWRRAFALAQELHPDLDYFAWGSDHDAWHPRWLESLLPELEAHPDTVLTYPRRAAIFDTGAQRRRLAPTFETAGVEDPSARAEMTWHAGGFGARVYGLQRAAALARCGVFHEVFLPDRLLLVELAVHGQFREVPEVLWYRRQTGSPSIERQRAAFFPDRRPSLSFRLPWYRAHSAILYWSLAVRGRARPQLSRSAGRALARRYLELGRELEAETQGAAAEEVADDDAEDAEEPGSERAPLPSAPAEHDADHTPPTRAS